MTEAAWVALLSPAAAVCLIALAGRRITGRQAGLLASGATLVSFVTTLVAFFSLLGRHPEERSETSTLWTWLSAGDLRVGLDIVVDPLSVFMMLVVSGVGFLILSYAVGYMAGDDQERRYHAYKALFVFSMLLLVQGGNLLLLLAGWGMVGLSSYLLINHWHHRPQAVQAGKKAFIMNAFGDATFVLALFILVQQTGSLEFGTVFSRAEEALGGEGSTLATLVALGLLGGAVAKSAQIPLHTWLPDAMEGPTPVSALIHAATMVTAGVYLIARTGPLFELAPEIHDLAAILGGVTIVVAGLIALVQTDIKRVIAYSTMSQIGYMFVAAGLGAYGAGLFHLMTHAFFKALLFMAAGIVIHALAGEQDIRNMGGLGRELPWTYRFMLVGALALAAVPPFAGFFSKDAILASAANSGTLGWALWAAAAAGAFLTALYTFRMIFVVFGGSMSAFAREHLHKERFEGPLAMVWPVAILAVLAVVGGFLQVPSLWHAVDDWIHPVVESVEEASGGTAWFSAIAALVLSLLGIAAAWALYGRKSPFPRRVRERVPWAARTLEQKFYFDEAYDLAFYEPSSHGAVGLHRFVERPVFLSSLGDLGTSVRWIARRLAAAQTGVVRSYALAVACGLVALAVGFLIAS
jgi:NADH-quinone oxidoreductase subunit L